MNKKVFALAVLFCALLSFVACSDDDDNGIDEEWKAYNEELVREVMANDEYKELKSLSENGYVYRKKTDFFDGDNPPAEIVDPMTPFSTDSVVVRYEGWYFLEDGTKVIFDTTEGDANDQAGRGFRISGMDSEGAYTGVVDGWVTILMNMRAGEAYEVCIPQQLAYGPTGNYDSYGYQTIPGYTTLWFNIKLLKIITDR